MRQAKPYRLSFGFLIAVVIVLFAGATLSQGRFGYSEVCRQCGTIRQATEWQIPFTRLTMFRSTSERQTPVSQALLGTGLAKQHEHHWLFVAGGGNGTMCAIGDGRHISPTAESAGVARLIEASHKYGDRQFCDKLLQTVFDPKTSGLVRGLGMRVPKNGFEQASDLHAWIAEESGYFDEMVVANRKR